MQPKGEIANSQSPPSLYDYTERNDPPILESPSLGPQRWWRRKRCFGLLLVMLCLVIFGIVFGVVYSVKHSSSKDSLTTLSSGEFASQISNRTRTTSAPGRTSSPNSTLAPIPSSTAEVISQSLSLSPSPSNTILLSPAESKVPRNIGAAAGTSSPLVVWDLRVDGKLWAKEYTGDWQECTSRRFLVAPVAIEIDSDEPLRMAFSIDAYSSNIVYMFFVDGHWEHDNWHELAMDSHFFARPTVIGRSPNYFDVFNIDSEGRVFTVSYDGSSSSWGSWTELGSGFYGDLSATSWDENRIDVFGKYRDNNHVLHGWWTPTDGWTKDFEDLGSAFSWQYEGDVDTSSPLTVSWRTPEGNTFIDVFMAGQSTYHNLYINGEWADWAIMSASHEGYEFSDTQSLVSGDIETGILAHLISRGTDDCIHYAQFNGTQWGFWQYLWCAENRGTQYVTEHMPTVTVEGEDGTVNFVTRDMEGKFIRYQAPKPPQPSDGPPWSNDNWELLGYGG